MSLRYAHMCKMDHHEVGYSNWDDENCPVCRERAAREKAEAEVARLKVVEKWARMIANAGELGADGYWHADITTPDSPPSCLTESEGER